MTPLFYEGPERRSGPERRQITQDRFEMAIEQAATNAAQRVAAIHRWRLVRWTWMSAALTGTVVILTLWFAVLAPQERGFSRQNAIYNCRVYKQATAAINDFVERDAELRSFQINPKNNISARLIRDFGKIVPLHDLNASVRANVKETRGIVAAWNRDARVLNGIVGIDCQAKLTG